MNENFERFLDDKGRVKTWPSKKEMKQHILRYISNKFEYGRVYSEKEVNCILEEWHTDRSLTYCRFTGFEKLGGAR